MVLRVQREEGLDGVIGDKPEEDRQQDAQRALLLAAHDGQKSFP
jgi:hypothetical protein